MWNWDAMASCRCLQRNRPPPCRISGVAEMSFVIKPSLRFAFLSAPYVLEICHGSRKLIALASPRGTIYAVESLND